jgi:DNA-binding beta-propeller fold protein YncE
VIAPATTKPPGGKEHVVPAPHVVGTIHVGMRPVNVEVAAGSAWIASTGTPTLDRVPLGGRHRHRGPLLGYGITDVSDRRGELWVTVAVPRQVVRVRASTGHTIGTPIQMSGAPRAIDAGEGAVWVAEQSPTGPDYLVEIDPHTATVVGRLAVAEGINDIRAANGAVWVLGRHSPTLIKVSPATRQPIVRLPMGRHAERVDTAAGYVWVTDYGDDAVTRVDPKGPKIVETDVPGKPYGLHARDDGVWVACYGDQSVVRIDPRTGRLIGQPIRVGFNPVAVDVRGHSVWVTSVSDNRLTRIAFG